MSSLTNGEKAAALALAKAQFLFIEKIVDRTNDPMSALGEIMQITQDAMGSNPRARALWNAYGGGRIATLQLQVTQQQTQQVDTDQTMVELAQQIAELCVRAVQTKM